MTWCCKRLALVAFELFLESEELGEGRIRIGLLAAALLLARAPGARRPVVVATITVAVPIAARRTAVVTLGPLVAAGRAVALFMTVRALLTVLLFAGRSLASLSLARLPFTSG